MRAAAAARPDGIAYRVPEYLAVFVSCTIATRSKPAFYRERVSSYRFTIRDKSRAYRHVLLTVIRRIVDRR